MEGTVKFFNETKGFGFIAGDNGKDYFFHKSQVESKVILESEDRVFFNEESTSRGLAAASVSLLE